MTSSGSSETDSARQRAAGASTASRRRISTPPPPGRWTSSSTTSGARATISATAASTSPASPTTATRPSSSARTPARNSAWSSTSTTLGSSVVSVIEHQLHLRALAGRAVDRRAAAVSAHASHDGLAQAAPVGRHGAGVEAVAAVADEDLGVAVDDLDVQRDGLGRAAVPRGVVQRLARGRDQRAVALVEVAVADGDDVDGHAEGLLGLGGRGAQRVAEALVRPRLAGARQPRAQLALLAAGERRHRARVVGALLDERERLEHRVVQVRGDLGALLRADPLSALGVEAPDEAQ